MDVALDPESAAVAVIGMAGRFPGAANLDAFWDNLMDGVESITRWTAEGQISALGVLERADEFDAGLFGCSRNEALTIDPQQRQFLECSWEALEDAGHDPSCFAGEIGTFAGSSETAYAGAVRLYRARAGMTDAWQRLRLGTGLDFLTTRVAYKLGLRGPAVTVQTACSTSLVATHLAAQSLLAGDCDLALAGGVTVHLWEDPDPEADEEYLATDGHCRAFDAGALGTVFGNGVGVVVLRRLDDALADGDRVRAVLRGSAINNDGREKIGFTAPSIDGQARVIRAAHLAAGVSPESITYVEAHGTGTPVGDPIEIAALTRAFRCGTPRAEFCRIGSVKTNIGHTDAAAGVAGLIKTVLALEHRWLPASLHFDRPNPAIDFAGSPFVVNDEGRDWPGAEGQPRRAGVSSLGIGGTNAHVVLEQAPGLTPPPRGRSPQLLVCSARTEPAVASVADRLGRHLRNHPDLDLADVAWTLQTGRRALPCRRFAVCADVPDAARALGDRTRWEASTWSGRRHEVVFVFPGQGSQHLGMGRDLYDHEEEFRRSVDECSTIAAPLLGIDLREILYPEPAHAAEAQRRLQRLDVAQPAVFLVEYALAALWQRWGVRPAAVTGHSLGAYVAACVAGVLSLPDAVRLVVERGRLLDSLPAGAMLAVPVPEQELAPLLPPGTSTAVVNGPVQVVAAGLRPAIDELAHRLRRRGIEPRLLRIPAAGHSEHVEPVLPEFRSLLSSIPLHPATIPLLSDSTGAWVAPEDTADAEYWVRHLRHPVRFADVLDRLLDDPDRLLLEVGPGRVLTSLARQHPAAGNSSRAVASLPHPAESLPARTTMLSAAGRLWLAGVPLDWQRLHEGDPRQRVRLPAYPFEHQRYAVPPPPLVRASAAGDGTLPEAGLAAGDDAAADATPTGPVPSADGLPDSSATPMESRLIEAFAAVLGGPVGIHDNFFDLGGDSISAAELVRRLRNESGLRVAVRQVFQAPTAAHLAAVLGRMAAS